MLNGTYISQGTVQGDIDYNTEKYNFYFQTLRQTMGSVLVNILALRGVSNESDWNFLHGDTSHITQNQITLTNRSSKFCQVTFVEVFIPYPLWWIFYYIMMQNRYSLRSTVAVPPINVNIMSQIITQFATGKIPILYTIWQIKFWLVQNNKKHTSCAV